MVEGLISVEAVPVPDGERFQVSLSRHELAYEIECKRRAINVSYLLGLNTTEDRILLAKLMGAARIV